MTQDAQDLLFSCRLDNAKVIHTVLTCLVGAEKRDQSTVLEATAEGLCFMVLGQAKYTQANGMLRKELFQAYRCAEPGDKFTVNLRSVLECLQVFGVAALGQTSVSLSYRRDTGLFRMSLEEQAILTICEIVTYAETEDAMELSALASAFQEGEEVFKAILRAEHLREVMAELGDVPGADTVILSVSAASPPLQFSTQGSFGYCDLELHANSQTFVHVECAVERRWQYNLAAVLKSMRALQHAKDTFLRINEAGILCVQHQIPSSSGSSVYIDWLLCAEENDEEDAGDIDDAARGETQFAKQPSQSNFDAGSDSDSL